MADAIVSIVLEQLGSALLEEVRVTIGGDVAAKVQELARELSYIQAFLQDAESRRIEESVMGRHLLSKLKDASYDIDDLLYTWNAALHKQQMEQVNEISSKFSEKVSSFISSHFFCCRQALLYRGFARKVNYLTKTLENITRETRSYSFGIIGHRREEKRRMTTHFIDFSGVYGRDHDKNEIIKLLLSVGSAGQTLPVISIVGMGGIGKTTVAQLAYNDDRVNTNFDRKIWVCVSHPSDEIRVAQEILDSLKGSPQNEYGLENVLVRIRESVEGKKILLVLDDVWSEYYQKWESLKHYLEPASLGSKILVTTRNENVAISMRTTNIIQLGKLSHEESWSLFSHIVFYGNESEEECKIVEDIGKIIVKKCDGLPLVIKAIGIVLYSNKLLEDWERILGCDFWEDVMDEVFTSLRLSYDDLPSMFKKCFLYCAIFPKDYKIIKDKLIKLWMAQGYLEGHRSYDEVLVGEECFDHLAMCFFFQEFERSEYDGSIISCKMHNIMHDLARFLVKNECCSIEIDGLAKPQLELHYKEARHLMIIGNPTSIYVNNEKLRSLIVERTASDFKIGVDLSKLFDKLTCIRTLDLSSCSLEEIQEGIKKLISLRYLNLSHNVKLEKLPETLCELYYLETLDVTNCFRLQKLPHGLGRLSKLRHLRNHGTSLSYMPRGIQRLTNLRELSKFVVSNVSDDNKACSLVGLENLKDLRGFLLITGLGNVSGVGEVKKAKLEDKKNLCGLGLRFDGWMYAEDEGIFIDLQPPPNLEELMIQYYTGRTMPLKWILSLTKLRVLKLSSCFEFKCLPALGELPTLESLMIWNMTSVKKVGNEFLIESGNKSPPSSSSFSVFPNLKDLAMWSMEEWEEWEESDFGVTSIMPCLHSLKLSSCPKLKSLPMYIIRPTSRLEKLEIKNCGILEQCYNRKTGQDFPKVSHIPGFLIMDDSMSSTSLVNVNPEINSAKMESWIQDKGKGKMPIDFSTTMGSDPRTSNSV